MKYCNLKIFWRANQNRLKLFEKTDQIFLKEVMVEENIHLEIRLSLECGILIGFQYYNNSEFLSSKRKMIFIIKPKKIKISKIPVRSMQSLQNVDSISKKFLFVNETSNFCIKAV
ncbi:hypothetical protein BpHYR1_035943 [Brachionus plicatilis]|uniref:Uncharacterized protein n=1 Tax=Brachionus plicatilis TaxID=10195 RepID=A0A3M7QRK4_BRAPC|nr:hypothetical protein BpHYR1_035943 [Brachionus plicatilis]